MHCAMQQPLQGKPIECESFALTASAEDVEDLPMASQNTTQVSIVPNRTELSIPGGSLSGPSTNAHACIPLMSYVTVI